MEVKSLNRVEITMKVLCLVIYLLKSITNSIPKLLPKMAIRHKTANYHKVNLLVVFKKFSEYIQANDDAWQY